MAWNFPGTPPYLDAQGVRLGITKIIVDRARQNPEIHRCSVILGHCCANYHRARKVDGKPVLQPIEIKAMVGSLEQAQLEASKLHALAGAADAMIDEAYEAIGVPRPPRPFAVMCDFDGATRPTATMNGAAIGPDGAGIRLTGERLHEAKHPGAPGTKGK